MINRINQNTSFKGKLNVFSFNPKTKILENTLIDTATIKAFKASTLNGKRVNVLFYRTPDGVKKCISANIFPDFTEMKLKTYLKEQIKKANLTENVIDVLL